MSNHDDETLPPVTSTFGPAQQELFSTLLPVTGPPPAQAPLIGELAETWPGRELGE